MLDWEELQNLQNNRGWAALRKYLWDYRARMVELIADGGVKPEDVQEAIFRCQALKDLHNLTYQDIRNFYGEDSADETSENNS